MTNKTFKILIPDILNSCVNWYNRARISFLVTTMKKEWCSLAASLLLEQTQGRGVLTAKDYSTWTWFFVHVDNSSFGEETQEEELLPPVGLGPTAFPCPADAGAVSAPQSQALDARVGLFHREGFVAAAKRCLMRLHLLVSFTGLGCRSLLVCSLHRQVSCMKKIGFASSFFFGSSMFFLSTAKLSGSDV